MLCVAALSEGSAFVQREARVRKELKGQRGKALERSVRDDEHRRLGRELKPESAMVAPLLGRERTPGDHVHRSSIVVTTSPVQARDANDAST